MNKVHVNIGPLKKDIIFYLDTGYDADKQLCIGILNLIDEHTFKDNPWPCSKPIEPIIDADTNQAQQGILDGAEDIQSERDTVLDIGEILESLCKTDLYWYIKGVTEGEDVGKCRGKDCNYCGRYNEKLR